MKFFSAILVTVACAAVVSASPTSSKGCPFLNFVGQMKGNGIDMTCPSGVFNKVTEGSELKRLWTEAKAKLVHLHDVEWAKCFEMEEPQQHDCKVAVTEQASRVISALLRSWANDEKDWPLIQEVNDKIVAECYNGGISEEAKQKLRQKVKCVLDAITEAVKGTDFAPVWEIYAKHLVDQFVRLVACTNKSTIVDKGRCIVAEYKKDEHIRNQFRQALKKVSKEEWDHAITNVKTKCFHQL